VSRIALQDGEIDLDAGQIRRGGRSAPISPTEARILTVLADANGEPVGKEALIGRVWGEDRGGSNTLEKAIQRLRTKVEADPRNPAHLLTVHGTGYRLVGGQNLRAASLFGRGELTRSLRAWLEEPGARISVVGPGGIGKTALARCVTEGRLAGFADLSEVREPVELLGVVVRALGLGPGGRTAEEVRAAIGSALAHRGGVLVLDNAESLPEAAAELVACWPRARVLVTSRVRLGFPGERLCDLPPLATGDARALFLARSRRAAQLEAHPRFAPLLDKLDGLPLAIELAAAWSDQLDMEELIGRIERGQLSDPQGDRPSRHASLEAVIGFSWRRLAAPARRALADLSRFRGPFDLEGAEALIRHPRPVELLQELVDRSLVRRTPPGGLRRLQIAHGVRLYALRAEPDEGAAERWRAFVLRRGERLLQGSTAQRAQLVQDLPELLALVREGTDEERVRAATIALDPLKMRGPVPLLVEVAEAALAAGARAGGALEAVARREHVFALRAQGRLADALEQGQRALALAGADDRLRAAALKALALVHHLREEPEPAIRYSREAGALLRALGDERMAARAEADLADMLARAGEPDPELESRARAAFHRLGDTDGEARIALTVAQRAAEAGLVPRAQQEAQAALTLARQAGLDGLVAVALATLGVVAWERGELQAAARWGSEAVATLEGIGSMALATQVRVYELLWRALAGEVERGLEPLRALAAEGPVRAGAAAFLAVLELGRGDREAAERALAVAQGPVAELARAALRETRESGELPAGSADARRLRAWLSARRPAAP
jgi:DNA-binding winged helix-turn-helix (wHTH) protein/tetratricopeptide (TPR) repeat protein